MRGGMFASFLVMTTVVGLVCYFKILRAVVRSVSVYMVNYLSTLKGSAQIFLHNISMLKHIPVLVNAIRVINTNLDIAICFDPSATFPVCTVYSTEKMAMGFNPWNVALFELGFNTGARPLDELSFRISHFINYTTNKVDTQ